MQPRIMVVEDEEALGTLLSYNLEAEGYDVEVIGRGVMSTLLVPLPPAV